MSYEIEQRDERGTPCLVVTGAADVRAAEDLAVRLQPISTAAVVDLKRATLVDSRMMAVLVHATERLRGLGGDLTVVCTSPDLLRVFRRMGLDGQLTLDTGEGRTSGRS